MVDGICGMGRDLGRFEEKAKAIAAINGATRVAYRFVADSSAPRFRGEEARMHLSGKRAGECIVCVGLNSPERRLSREEGRKEDALLEKARKASERNGGKAAFLKAGLESKYSFEVPATVSPGDVRALAGLYAEAFNGGYWFQISEASIRRILCGKGSVVAAARDRKTGEIASCYVGQVTDFGGGILMAEIGEAATSPQHRMAGLGSVLAHLLAGELFRRGVDLAFAETRATTPTSSITIFRLGAKYAGRLVKAVRMPREGRHAEKEGAFESLNLLCLNRGEFSP
ncbi:MAG: hypothetical protein PHF51_01160 [Candidatus ainarchaeum sp.]|nr:hypothetical protein [Candidatus ainarchaeum sp.]